MTSKSYNFATRCIRGGLEADPQHGAVLPPIYQTTTFRNFEVGKDQIYSYSRVENPTVAALEARLGVLEDCLPAVTFGSGMAAVSTLLLAEVSAGDRIVCSDVVYGGTFRFIKEVLEPLGVKGQFVDTSDLAAVRDALHKPARLLLLETPANPTLKLTDIAACSAEARAVGVPVVVDNTFLTPVLQRPLELGADASLYSTTKYIDGHNATVGGAICTRDPELRERLVHLRKCLGTILTPHNAWLTLQGLKTLPLRLERQTDNALRVAAFLAGHPGVEAVHHPDLETFPQRELARRQQDRGGALVTVELRGGLEAAVAALGALKLGTPAENLGAVETLVTHNATMTHASIPAAERAALGITDGLVRISVGLEDAAEIIADLDQALAIAARRRAHA
ncbi:MAG: PLP-dependent transferase [bacterium]|nr:PLP-dependent transferase [bacterium]